jgi:cytoskeleton protein RodZ
MSKAVGRELRQARLDQGYTLEQAAKNTHIRLQYLEALEAGDFDSLPSITQARGFMRVYAGFLKLNPDTMVSILDAPLAEPEESPYIPYTTESPAAQEEIEAEKTRRELVLKGQAIIVDLGQSLRQQRETLGISLQDVERHTHLRVHYLRALEAGDLSSLPSPVQGRGMLKNYATFLGMDTDLLLMQFAEALQTEYASRQPERVRPQISEKKPKKVSPLRRFLSGDLLLISGIVVFLVVFISWGIFQIASARDDLTPTPDAPSIADVLAPPDISVTPLATQMELEDGPSPGITQEGLTEGNAEPTTVADLPLIDPSQGSLQVYVSARQRAWMRVTVDGEVEFEGIVVIGTVYPFSGFEQIEVITGNGSGLIIYFGGENLGPMGFFGEVVNRIYTAEGVLNPTPTITPTVTQTPQVTSTPPPTLPSIQP